jgi:hypothetical protein
MRHTHNVLAEEKKRQMQAVNRRINQASQDIQLLLNRSEELGNLAVEYTALIAYEERLSRARTWPYNTTMIRTVFFTVLAPLLLRGVSDLLFGK